jgi:hypothetical protein
MQLGLKRNQLLTYNILMALLGVCFGFGGQMGGMFGALPASLYACTLPCLLAAISLILILITAFFQR